MIKNQSTVDENERSLYSIKQLETYFDIIDRSANFYKVNIKNLTSDDYIALFERIVKIAESSEYTELKKGSAKILNDISNVKSICIGFNFDASLTPYEAGVISINKYYIESGSLIDRLLRFDLSSNNMSMAPLISAKLQCKPDEFENLELSLYCALAKILKSKKKNGNRK